MGPLAGIKVLEIKGLGPGPYAGMLLADLGAQVVVVERPEAGPLAPPSEQDLFSRGKQRLTLDLKASSDRDALLELVDSADVLIESFRPGVAERLGIGPEVCLKRRAALVYARLTGWGQSGPLAQRAGHDINYLAITGVLSATGTTQTPVVPLNLIGDFAGGSLFMVMGVLAALVDVRASGKGQVIDAAIVDGAAHLMTLVHTLSSLGQWQPARASNLLDGSAPFYRVYATKDHRHVAVGALEPAFFTQLITTLGLPKSDIEGQYDRQRWPEMAARLERAFKQKTRDEWAGVFAGADACVTPVLDYQEAAEHAHNVARANHVSVNGTTQAAPAPRFSRTTPAEPRAPADMATLEEVRAVWS